MTDQEVTQVFIELINDSNRRLKHGLKLRQEIADALDRGETPTGYRVDLLRLGAVALVNKLEEIGKQFNKDHPNDQFSLGDVLDILATATALVQKKF
jgi:hypothetical protein